MPNFRSAYIFFSFVLFSCPPRTPADGSPEVTFRSGLRRVLRGLHTPLFAGAALRLATHVMLLAAAASAAGRVGRQPFGSERRALSGASSRAAMAAVKGQMVLLGPGPSLLQPRRSFSGTALTCGHPKARR